MTLLSQRGSSWGGTKKRRDGTKKGIKRRTRPEVCRRRASWEGLTFSVNNGRLGGAGRRQRIGRGPRCFTESSEWARRVVRRAQRTKRGLYEGGGISGCKERERVEAGGGGVELIGTVKYEGNRRKGRKKQRRGSIKTRGGKTGGF